MAFYRCFPVSSGGGTDVKTGTLTTTNTASATYEIDTGLSSISNFTIHGVNSATYVNNMQFFLRYDSSLGSNFYWISHYSNNGEVGYGAFTSTAKARGFVITSVSGGKVTIKAPTSTAWCPANFTWWAW